MPEEEVEIKGIRADGLGNPLFLFKRKRYLISITLLIGYAIANALRLNLSVAILYIGNTDNNNGHGGKNHTTKKDEEWDERTQGQALSALFYGYIMTQIIGGYLAGYVGGKNVILIGISGSGIISFLAPVAAIHSFVALFVVRFISGLLLGLMIPAANDIWRFWAPPLERTILTGIAISGIFMSAVVVLPVCGAIGRNSGWEWMFYVFGIQSIIWGIVWFFLFARSPAKDKHMKDSEREYIIKSFGDLESSTVVHPWMKILFAPSVWAIVAAHFGHNWGFYLMTVYGVKLLTETVKFDVELASLCTGVAFVLNGLFIQLGSQVSDVLRTRGVFSTLAVRKIFCCGGFCSQTVFILLAAFIPVKEVVVTVVILTTALGGFTWSGFYANALDIAPPHSAVIMGISNTLGTLPGFLTPTVISQILPNTQDPELNDWLWIWAISACVYFVCGSFFLFLAKGERQNWAY